MFASSQTVIAISGMSDYTAVQQPTWGIYLGSCKQIYGETSQIASLANTVYCGAFELKGECGKEWSQPKLDLHVPTEQDGDRSSDHDYTSNSL